MGFLSKAADKLGGAADIVSGFGPAFEIAGGYFANEANAKQAELNRRFQRQMSNTAYQRAVRDMRAAGLNPMLAGINSSPASTPGGATATMRNAFQGLSSNARTARLVKQEQKNLEATEGQIVSTAAVNRARATQANTQSRLNEQHQRESEERELKTRQERRLRGFDIHLKRAEAKLYETLGVGAVGLQKLAPGLLGGGTAAAILRRGVPGKGVLNRQTYKKRINRRNQRDIARSKSRLRTKRAWYRNNPQNDGSNWWPTR